MAVYGQAIKQDVFLIKTNPITDTPLDISYRINACCINLPVLAEEIFTDDIFNDKTGALFFWGSGFISADIYLQKEISGVWTDVAALSANTYGTAYPFAFNLTNLYRQNAIGYQLEWKLVLNDGALGEGKYRVRSTGTTLIGGATVTKYTFEYCLSKYTVDRADDTVRIDWVQAGNFGDWEDDQLRVDYGPMNWSNSIRLPGAVFGFDTSPEIEETRVKYQNGAAVWLSSSQIEKYILKMGRYDQQLHKYIKVNILQSDFINITDYNIDNPTRHKNKYVILSGGYEPVWTFGSKTANVEVQLAQYYQNFNHKRS